ncbi:uncharacterized protein LOC111881581 [Lactuca sativa]|uniref:PB1 domain-containing protein n=1 Tax=Lactuca sativa TaxID=4236 RepID=A0A9R1W749_LACSA|nr:uncharacterized protein LOC111881581 [Lactuca sativa]KAJ0217542.1 hypothetical protein LSAT_V11C300112670 [Lactuca sativa]
MAGPSLSNLEHPTTANIKFLCSYGGKILPRYPDGKLRYHGGETRVLAVDRYLSFSELVVKLGELSGTSMPVALRCQLPTEDLDALVSITSDEDLVNLIEEYDRVGKLQSSSNLKIRAFLSLQKKSSPTSSTASSPSTTTGLESSSPSSDSNSLTRFPMAATNHYGEQMLKPQGKLPFRYERSSGNLLRYACQNSSQSYQLLHNDNHCNKSLRYATDFRSENFCS